jgi:hypothetical protein
MWTFSHMQREGKNIHRGAIFQKRRNTKIPKDKKPKPVSLPWLQPLLKKKKKTSRHPFPPFGLGKANQRNHTNTQIPAELPPSQQIFFPFDLPHSSWRPQHPLSCSCSPS